MNVNNDLVWINNDKYLWRLGEVVINANSSTSPIDKISKRKKVKMFDVNYYYDTDINKNNMSASSSGNDAIIIDDVLNNDIFEYDSTHNINLDNLIFLNKPNYGCLLFMLMKRYRQGNTYTNLNFNTLISLKPMMMVMTKQENDKSKIINSNSNTDINTATEKDINDDNKCISNELFSYLDIDRYNIRNNISVKSSIYAFVNQFFNVFLDDYYNNTLSDTDNSDSSSKRESYNDQNSDSSNNDNNRNIDQQYHNFSKTHYRMTVLGETGSGKTENFKKITNYVLSNSLILLMINNYILRALRDNEMTEMNIQEMYDIDKLKIIKFCREIDSNNNNNNYDNNFSNISSYSNTHDKYDEKYRQLLLLQNTSHCIYELFGNCITSNNKNSSRYISYFKYGYTDENSCNLTYCCPNLISISRSMLAFESSRVCYNSCTLSVSLDNNNYSSNRSYGGGSKNTVSPTRNIMSTVNKINTKSNIYLNRLNVNINNSKSSSNINKYRKSNFHIFYSLLYGLRSIQSSDYMLRDLCRNLKLDTESFKVFTILSDYDEYCKEIQNISVDNCDGGNKYGCSSSIGSGVIDLSSLLKSLKQLKCSTNDIKALISMLACILHLGTS
jgi:hypothetical protein